MDDVRRDMPGQLELLALVLAAVITCAPVAYSSIRASQSVRHTEAAGRAAEVCTSVAELLSSRKGDASSFAPDGALYYDSDWNAVIPSSPDVPSYALRIGTLPAEASPGHGMVSVAVYDMAGNAMATSWASWQEVLP